MTRLFGLPLFTSSISVYGPSEEPQSEESPLHPISAYGRSKVAAELIHRQWRNEIPERRRLIIARPAVIFGLQERGNFTRLATHLKSGTFVYPGRKETIKSCGYVKDLVGSFAYFLSQPIGEITYNFGFTERFTTEDICRAFTKAAGYKLPKWIVPIQAMTMAGLAFEILGKLGLKTSINRSRMMKLYRSTNIIPKQLDAFGFARKFGLQEALVNWKQQSGGDRFE